MSHTIGDEIEKAKKKYHDRVICIVRPVSVELSKTKYVLPPKMRVSEFLIVLRKYMPSLKETDAIFLYRDSYFNQKIYRCSDTFDNIKDDFDDGVVNLILTIENTFGDIV